MATKSPQPAKPASRQRNRRLRRKQNNNINNYPIQPSSISQVLGQLPNQTRSGRTPNPADPRTSLTVNFGRTLSGALAAQKILHPCGEYDIQPVKIPDGAVSTSVVLERRDEYEVQAPTTIGTAPSWVCVMVHQPFLNHRDIIMRYPSTVSPSEDVLHTILLYANIEDYSGTTPTAAIYPTFKAASTLTGIPSIPGTASIEYSVLTSSTLTPALLQTDDNHTSLYKDIRRTALGYTTDLDASELYNQGRVVSGQWSPSVTKGTYDFTTQITTGATPPATVTVVQNSYDTWDYTLPAVTSSTIVSSDMFRRQAEAKYGSYMPIRICADTIEFTAASALRQVNCLSPGDDAATKQADNYPQRNANDIYLAGWSVGSELWLNLDPHAQLRLKVVENLELDPAPSSTFSPFMSPGYSRDDQALSVIREFARISPHAFDADFNRLNKMFTNLINGLGDVLSNLGIPIVSSVSKPLARGITGLWGYQAPQPTGIPPDMGMTQMHLSKC